jgi:hypothetical protein
MANSTIVIEHEKSDDNSTDQIGDAPSPEHFMPRTPEHSYDTLSVHDIGDAGFTTHAFLQAGIPTTSKGVSLPSTLRRLLFADVLPDLPDNCRATTAVNSTSSFLIDEADEAEKAAASAGFYGEFTVEEFPSPYHAPFTDQISGFGDVRDGAEAFPQQWQDNERRPRAYNLAEADAMTEDYPMDTAGISTKAVVMPMSRQPATGRSQHDGGYSPVAVGLTSEDSSEKEPNSPGQDSPSLTPIALTTAKGRNARLMTRLSQSHSSIQVVVVCLLAARYDVSL